MSNTNANHAMRADNVNVFYGKTQALHDVSIDIQEQQVTALIGPSGCGKSTFLRCLNRMNDVIDECSITGQISLGKQDIYAPNIDVVALRRKIGMVFQKTKQSPKSIFDNIAYGPRLKARQRKSRRADVVERSLRAAFLWDEVKDRLSTSALRLSGGQQQRLCIARTLAVTPVVILFDEPCSALDPISTAKIEDLIGELKRDYTIVIVTHNMQQAARVSDYTGFMYLGELIELGKTEELFVTPKERLTEEYITGKFG